MIRIIEVGPRDGLQNEKIFLSVEDRLALITQLIDAGLKNIEVGAFVSSQRVPQMANSQELYKKLNELNLNKKIQFPGLVPNEQGMLQAVDLKLKEIAIFTAASESFNKANINCSIEESFERFKPVLELAKKNKIKVRGYLSTCFYCPYEGKVKPKKVVQLVDRLLKLGCFEVSIGDTIGAATPKDVADLCKLLKSHIKRKKIAMHFHDTRGTALANILESLKWGIQVFDSSIGGLGGCPFAPGAQGNVATEDVVYMLHGMGIKTGINLPKLIEIHQWLKNKMSKELPSRLGNAKLPMGFKY